ncbi:hypothetical protein [Streptomyces sp. NPDC048639]|uniref:DUF7848 domain-containing protein n=1 Tax=Streptomyces sp. NPDC048639 TaxID=3365581 RepID=UPI003718F115
MTIRSIIEHAEWTIRPDEADGEPRQPTYEAQCATCKQSSGAVEAPRKAAKTGV